MAERRGLRIPFEFIPMPLESITAEPPLSLAELKLLLYLLKQVRFGEAPEPLSDDELLNGTFNLKKEREDQGCGLSRGSLRTGRELLVERGWLELESVSNDKSRPRFVHRLILENTRRIESVKNSQQVTKFVTDKESELVSKIENAVSNSVNGVTKKSEEVTKFDTFNKEDRKTKYLDKELEKAGEGKPPVTAIKDQKQENLDIADRKRLMQWIEQLAPPIGTYVPSKDAELISRIKAAAEKSAISYSRAKELLSIYDTYRTWEPLRELDSQREIFEETA